MSVWFYSHTCLTGDIVVPELTQFLLTLTHWITKYQKSCDYPYWSGWKPSMYGDLRVDTIFPKVWFSFDSPLSLTSSPVSHVGKWQSPASPEHWAVQFHLLSRSVSFSGLDKCSSFVISFFKYQCFMEEKVSVSALTVPVRRMILSSVHCRADPLSACLCSERWGVCFRIKALHRDVHTDARDLGLSRCQMLHRTKPTNALAVSLWISRAERQPVSQYYKTSFVRCGCYSPSTPAIKRLRQQDHKFKASLSYKFQTRF